MKITREALKRIVIQEMTRMEDTITTEGALTPTLTGQIGVTPDEENEDPEAIGEISEGEGIEVIQAAAEALERSGLTAVTSVEEAKNLILGLVKLGNIGLGGATLGLAGNKLVDAIKFLMNNNQEPPASRDDY